ncbi:MAG: DUF5615 family PIN-like protein [Haloarculaceae archaeon]
MSDAEWGFLLDENVDRRVAARLRTHGHRVAMVVDELGPGAADRADVLPYARQEDLVVVTKDVSDFGEADADDHEGVILVFDDRLDGDEMADGIRRLVLAYPSRDALRGREVLDEWL